MLSPKKSQVKSFVSIFQKKFSNMQKSEKRLNTVAFRTKPNIS